MRAGGREREKVVSKYIREEYICKFTWFALTSSLSLSAKILAMA